VTVFSFRLGDRARGFRVPAGAELAAERAFDALARRMLEDLRLEPIPEDELDEIDLELDDPDNEPAPKPKPATPAPSAARRKRS
jgi:hypothetical protein